MSFVYTPHDIRKELETDPKHGDKFAFVLKEFHARGFSMGVQPLGLFSYWKVSERAITIDSSAKDMRQALIWARCALREWAYKGILDSIYFAEIARAWAKSQNASCTKCLGSTVDFLLLFSGRPPDDSGGGYPISSSIGRDLKGILLWVFVNWWDVGIVQGLDSTPVITDQRDLHSDYHDSQPGHYDEDQTHHFALYFYVGIKVGSSKLLLDPVLRRTHDLDDDGVILNEGDYYLGLTAARLGDDFDDHPRYMGAEITGVLQQPSPDKLKDYWERDKKQFSNVWIDQDRQVAHPAAPHKKGGPGYFASADPLSFDSEPGDLPHPNSPAGRTLDPLRIARFASKVESV